MIPHQRLVLDNVLSVRQFETGLRNQTRSLIRAAYQEVADLLRTKFADLTKFQQARLRAFLSRMEAMLTENYSHIDAHVAEQLRGLAKIQGRQGEAYLRHVLSFADAELKAEVNTTALTKEQLQSIVNYPIQGLKLGEWWKAQGQNAALAIKREVQMGLLRGEGIDDIVRNRLGVRKTAYANDVGAFRAARTSASMLVRTAVTSVQAQAHKAVFDEQPNAVTDQYEYHATLDSRTTIICASLDGSIWDNDDPKAPRPPQHFNCRSTILPVINWKGLGVKPPEQIVKAKRASMDGPVRNQTFEQWLKRQDLATQTDILGATRARLFRDGEVTLKDLVDRDGTTLTLSQLARKLGLDLD